MLNKLMRAGEAVDLHVNNNKNNNNNHNMDLVLCIQRFFCLLVRSVYIFNVVANSNRTKNIWLTLFLVKAKI